MTKVGWKNYINDVKLCLKYLQKELDIYPDDADIKAVWSDAIQNELKDIIRLTSDRL